MPAQPQPNQRSAPPVRAPSKMTLDAITRGKIEKPLRLLVIGVDGVGKSTFAAAAPSPIFLDAEDGSNNLDVARLPRSSVTPVRPCACSQTYSVPSPAIGSRRRSTRSR